MWLYEAGHSGTTWAELPGICVVFIWSFHVEFLKAFSSGVASGIFMWSFACGVASGVFMLSFHVDFLRLEDVFIWSRRMAKKDEKEKEKE